MKRLLPLLTFIVCYLTSYAQWSMPNGPGHTTTAFTSMGADLFVGMNNNGSYGGLYHSLDTGKTWTFRGLSARSINQLRTVGSKMYAANEFSGLWVSRDTGVTWTVTTLNTHNVNDVEVNSNFIYAPTDSGIYLSPDTGATWTTINTGLTNLRVYSVFLDGAAIYACTAGGLFKSTNNGGNWAPSGFTNNYVKQVGRIGTRLFAATYGGMFSSPDNGNTWNSINTGIPATIIECLLISGTKIYIGIGGAGIFTSVNNGNSWQNANTDLTLPESYIRTIYQFGTLVVTGGGLHHAGAYISENGGQSWQQRCRGISDAIAYAMCTVGNTMFCTDFAGVFKSTDDGVTWVPTASGLVSQSTNCIGTDGTNLYVSTTYGMSRSTDGGQSWTTINTGLPSGSAGALLVSGSNAFVAMQGNGIYLSTNYGGNWTAVNTGLGNLDVASFAKNGLYIFAGTGAGVYRSSNNGGNWSLASTGLPSTSINALTANNNAVIAGINGQYVYRSTTNGNSWAIDTTGFNNPYVLWLTCQGQNIFAGNMGSMFLSQNNGLTWSSISGNLGTRNVKSVYVNSGNVYAGTWGTGVWNRPLSDFGICNAPAVQAVNITFANITSTSVKVNWSDGDGSRRIVKIKPTNTFTSPVNSNDYTANSVYSGSGEQVVYNGTGNNVTVTGLSSNAFYWFRVYEASCSSINSLYITSIANGNPRGVSMPFYFNPNRTEEEESGIDAENNNSIQVYPNPTTSSITIESSSNNFLVKVIVSGIDGRVMGSTGSPTGHSEKVTVDLKELRAGIYFLDCVGENGRQMVKVVKY